MNNNLTDLGGGSVSPLVKPPQKNEFKPLEIVQGFFLSTMGLLISGISLIANSLTLHSS